MRCANLGLGADEPINVSERLEIERVTLVKMKADRQALQLQIDRKIAEAASYGYNMAYMGHKAAANADASAMRSQLATLDNDIVTTQTNIKLLENALASQQAGAAAASQIQTVETQTKSVSSAKSTGVMLGLTVAAIGLLLMVPKRK